ncbi:MAG: helix-turn-helix domain-containing protein [Propionibacteriaceae bacterium]|nr:helix-turn-helix domain-containing protein [Propionibacteriaceae bacterium]
MNERKRRRMSLGMSQTEAAAEAGVSPTTWHNWEEHPERVSAATRIACEAVLDSAESELANAAEFVRHIAVAWRDCPTLTPRQALALAMSLTFFGNVSIATWLDDPSSRPLYEVPPFDAFDLRVMMRIDENRAWAQAASRRCHEVVRGIENGVLPFDRPGCFFDEVVMAPAWAMGESLPRDDSDFYADVPARTSATCPPGWLCDDDWELVHEHFVKICRWPDWELPLMPGHPHLAALLSGRHPFTWFDVLPSSDLA